MVFQGLGLMGFQLEVQGVQGQGLKGYGLWDPTWCWLTAPVGFCLAEPLSSRDGLVRLP